MDAVSWNVEGFILWNQTVYIYFWGEGECCEYQIDRLNCRQPKKKNKKTPTKQQTSYQRHQGKQATYYKSNIWITFRYPKCSLNIVTFDTTRPPTTWFLYMNGRHEEGLRVSLMSINKNVLQLLSKYVNKLLKFFYILKHQILGTCSS